MNIELIGMLNKALKGDEVEYTEIVRASAKAGYIVHPDCATKDVLNFLNHQTYNPNSTFYKTWDDIVSKNKQQLFIDRLKHYLSTYGSDYTEEAYTENKDPIVIDFKSYKLIMPATGEEIFEDCKKILQSGIALSLISIVSMADFIKSEGFIDQIDINSIKNKEAKAVLADKLDKMPSDEFDLLRTIIYKYIGSTMLIKSRQVYKSITTAYVANNFNFNRLNDDQLKSLSKIFYRFKPLFLAFKKTNSANISYINKIRRYAKKYHKPFVKGFWENCLSLQGRNPDELLKQAESFVSNITNYKKIQLMQAIKVRSINSDMNNTDFLYRVRNGKPFIRSNYKVVVDKDYLTKLYDILKKSVIESLKTKATTYNIAENVHITAPTSEKNFVGNFPMGTSIDFSNKNNVIGIYWRNEWGTHDFDLHCMTIDGQHIGWNSDYIGRDETVVYSGDMTNADPEAAELMLFKNDIQDIIVSVNKFNGLAKSKLKLFVATEDCENKIKDGIDESNEYGRFDESSHYNDIMVDPNNIKFEAMIDFDDKNQLNIGYIHNKKLYLMTSENNCLRVPLEYSKINNTVQKVNAVHADSFIDIEPLLIEAGFKKSSVAELDFTNPSKEAIINLFA